MKADKEIWRVERVTSLHMLGKLLFFSLSIDELPDP